MERRKREETAKKVLIFSAVAAIMILIIGLGSFKDENGKDGLSYADPIKIEEIKIEQVREMDIDLGRGIIIEDIGKYTGIFMEDGTNEVIGGVLMAVVKNTTESTLQYAEIRFPTEKGEAFFSVSTLPPGASAVLLEKNRMPFDEKADYSEAFMGNVVFFSEEPDLQEDMIELQILEGGINVKNISGSDIFGDIVIYYKNSSDDMYYGGITYRIKIEGGLLAGETRQIMAKHFSKAGSTVMFVTIE